MQRVYSTPSRRLSTAVAAIFIVVGTVLASLMALGTSTGAVVLGLIAGLTLAWLLAQFAYGPPRPPDERLATRYADGKPFGRATMDARDLGRAHEMTRVEVRDEEERRARLDARRHAETDLSDEQGPPPKVPFP